MLCFALMGHRILGERIGMCEPSGSRSMMLSGLRLQESNDANENSTLVMETC